MPQYRADLIVILLVTFEILVGVIYWLLFDQLSYHISTQVSCVESVHELLHPTANNTVARLVHAKANILSWNLALVACPLKTLHRVAQVTSVSVIIIQMLQMSVVQT